MLPSFSLFHPICQVIHSAFADSTFLLPGVPGGWNLQAMDDCGDLGRQPHLRVPTAHVFPESAVEGTKMERGIAWGLPAFHFDFTGLDPALDYVLSVTYASEKGNRRIQTLHAGDIELHGPTPLPDGKAETLVFTIPKASYTGGSLTIRGTLVEGHNAVISVIALYAPAPSPVALYLDARPSIMGTVTGKLTGLDFSPAAGAEVTVSAIRNGETLAKTTSDDSGGFRMDLSGVVIAPGATLVVEAAQAGIVSRHEFSAAALRFDPPVYRPLPSAVDGVKELSIRLDGEWRLLTSPPAGFEAPGFTASGWGAFNVPGQWLQQGYDIPMEQPVGLLREFSLPPEWTGRRVILRFDSVHAGARYWLNGHELGTSENLFTPVEFDITDSAIIGGSNLLAISAVVKTPSEDASFTSHYAMHNLGGIDRSVRCFALPQTHLTHLRIKAGFAAGSPEGVLRINAKARDCGGVGGGLFSITVRLVMHDTGCPYLNHSGVRIPLGQYPVTFAPDGTGVVELDATVPAPRPWTAETPNLYAIECDLLQDGRSIETVTETIGFRNIEIKDSQLLVNGAVVKLAGINRHEVDPLTGRADCMRHAETDVRLFREANFNFIRTSHYPPPKELLDVCDRLGMYVEVEAPYCWARGGGAGEDDPSLEKTYVYPGAAMVEYLANHPCVLFWSIGNESGTTSPDNNILPANFASMLAWCRRDDPTRPFVFENEWCLDGGLCDIANLHYPAFPPEESSTVKDDLRPLWLGEYYPTVNILQAEEAELNPAVDFVRWSDGQNNPESYWNQIQLSTRCIGGAIWAGVDEQFYFPHDKGPVESPQSTVLGKGPVRGYNEWGFVDVWRRKMNIWWEAKMIHSPVFIPIRRVDYAPGQTAAVIPLINRYSFTDLSELTCAWEAGNAKGNAALSLAPRSNGSITIPVPPGTQPGTLLVLRFFDKTGLLVVAHGVRLGDVVRQPIPGPGGGVPEWTDDGRFITVRGEGFAFAIEHATGNITSCPDAPATPLKALPRLHAARRAARNVFAPTATPFVALPDMASRVVESIEAREDGRLLRIVLGERFEGFSGESILAIGRDGLMFATMEYIRDGEAFCLSEVGLCLLMDPSCDTLAWRCDSEWDIYPEGHIRRPEGVAKASRDAALTGASYTPPAWPWELDENSYGTRDFRSTKSFIHEASLSNPSGAGVKVFAEGDRDVRACRMEEDVRFHLLLASKPETWESGAAMRGSFVIGMGC